MLKLKSVFTRKLAKIVFQKAKATIAYQRAVVKLQLGKFLAVTVLSDTANTSDSGILLNQSYCEPFYFADDYTGEKRTL